MYRKSHRAFSSAHKNSNKILECFVIIFLLLSTFEVFQRSFADLTYEDLGVALCSSMDKARHCEWTGCESNLWSVSAHGCGPDKVLCGDPTRCPNGWQYHCCSVGPGLTVEISRKWRSLGKRVGAAVGSAAILDLLSNKKSKSMDWDWNKNETSQTQLKLSEPLERPLELAHPLYYYDY